MKKLNKKGFSMVEILAVIVILGVISTIGVVSVTKLIDKSRQHYYDTQESQLVLAAQAYATSDTSILPKTIYGLSTIKLQDLYDKKFIKEKVKDQNKRLCDPEKSHVDIFKSSKTDFIYTGYLNCPSCADEDGYCKTSKTGDAPIVDISFPDGVSGNNLFNGNAEITIELDAKGKNALIGSYSYKIYKNGELKYDSGNKINNKVATKTLKEKINKFLPGKIKVVATITNTEGVTTTKSKTQDFSDSIPPSCGKVSYDGTYPMNSHDSTTVKTCGSSGYTWINISQGQRQPWVVCNDVEGIGCAQHEFSSVLTSDGKTDTVTIKDANGNNYNCEVMKCIDKTSPSMVVKIKSGDTVKKTYTVDVQHTTVNKIVTEEYSPWLNKSTYPDGVTIEVKVADSLSKIKLFTWKQNDKEQNASNVGALVKDVETTDSINDTSYTTSHIITADGVRQIQFVTKDYAGNTVTFNLKVYVDRTAPTSPPTITMKKWANNDTRPTSSSGLSNYTNDTWLSGKVYTEPSGSTDVPNISSHKEYQFTTTGKTENNTNSTAAYRNIEAEGISYIKWRSCDNAGNCSAYSSQKTIKLDRTNPTCSISKSDRYSTSGITLTTNCKDDPATNAGDSSGVKTCEGKHTSVKSSKTYTVVDNADNSNTCTTTVYNQQKKDCSSCSRCASAGCEYAASCVSDCCGSTPICTWWIPDEGRYANSCNCAFLGQSSEYDWDSKIMYCVQSGSNPMSCTSAVCCGCNQYYADCSSCGCSSWGSWEDTTSCSESSSRQCRTIYY